jgi:nicotinamide mononucleotide transporter
MALSIGLAARNSVHTWPTGVLGCFLFAIVFVGNQLYADATLQLFFIATSFVGWWQWLHPTQTVDAVERPISKTRPQTLFWMTVAALAVTLLYGWMLHQFTDAYLPYIDSAVLALSVIAQCLLTQGRHLAFLARGQHNFGCLVRLARPHIDRGTLCGVLD